MDSNFAATPRPYDEAAFGMPIGADPREATTWRSLVPGAPCVGDNSARSMHAIASGLSSANPVKSAVLGFGYTTDLHRPGFGPWRLAT